MATTEAPWKPRRAKTRAAAASTSSRTSVRGCRRARSCATSHYDNARYPITFPIDLRMSLRLTQIAPGVHRLDSVYTNWYLVADGSRLTVLDAGLPRDWRDFSSALSRLGHKPADVDAVLITHHHLDHAGNAEQLR